MYPCKQDWKQRHQGQVSAHGSSEVSGAADGTLQSKFQAHLVARACSDSVQGNIAVFATKSLLTICLKQIHLSDMRNPSICNMQVCEKEMKIKAFSKEGLQAPQKDNPQERAKTEIRDNINKQVEQLETQVQLQ